MRMNLSDVESMYIRLAAEVFSGDVKKLVLSGYIQYIFF